MPSKSKPRKMPDIKALVRRLGGPSQIAGAINRTHSAVCQWKKVPQEYIPTLVSLSRHIGDPITAAEMRPDIDWAAVKQSL